MKIKKIESALVQYLWGGDKLKNVWNKDSCKEKTGESWELSFHKSAQSTIQGRPISEVTKGSLGENLENFQIFPVMTKIIDANDFLSIQVHPNDEYSMKHENQLGKTEMWYVLEAEEGAGIYLGTKTEMTKEQFALSIENCDIAEKLNFINVKKGDYFFIPSGVIHAIGKGITVFEVQQNSDVTYRIYDFDRVDADGQKRELHIEKSKDVSILKPYNLKNHIKEIDDQKSRLASNKYFATYLCACQENITLLATESSFHCITVIEGKGKIDGIDLKKGDSFFIPAGYGEYKIVGNVKVMLTKVEKYFFLLDVLEYSVKGRIVTSDGEELIAREISKIILKEDDEVIEFAEEMLQTCQMTSDDIYKIYVGTDGKGVKTEIIEMMKILEKCYGKKVNFDTENLSRDHFDFVVE